ncbi:aldo/keto reductase [Faecalicatena contorta]|uniref:aldo/keto reductase n=1 Tax=Faecalicatena contorta TaxID=39482 RepID=UPI001F33CDEE|nr:aldo/keto reductase [Faecalicatena contorta]MCF2681574.1 aldo/keto reductase [Faecalicatena contorta]
MGKVRLGSTGIIVNKTGFGGLPIQRISDEAAEKLLWMAYDAGINFYDTGKTYSDSEVKLGRVLSKVRNNVYIATKTPAKNAEDFWKDLDSSLERLQTDYIDIYQFHNPPFCPKPGDGTGLYEAALEAKAQGKIKHIGISSHKIPVAEEVIASGLYEVLQFPFCYLVSEKDMEIVEACKKADIGFIAMKALAGGVINNAKSAYAFQEQYDHVVPVWGIQRESELREFISYMNHPPVMDEEMKAVIEKDIRELSGDFCRGCGYCLPCPAGIPINNCARMSLLLRRSSLQTFLGEAWQENMKKIENCINCGACASRCPYGLNPPEMLRRNYEDYKAVLEGKVSVTR